MDSQGPITDDQLLSDNSVSRDVVKRAVMKTLDGITNVGKTIKVDKRSRCCMRPFIRRDNKAVKSVDTKCCCVRELEIALNEITVNQKLDDITRWVGMVKQQATQEKGSWKQAMDYVGESSVMGADKFGN